MSPIFSCTVPPSECCGGCDLALSYDEWLADQYMTESEARMERLAERRARPRLRYRVSLMPAAYWSRSVRDGLPF